MAIDPATIGELVIDFAQGWRVEIAGNDTQARDRVASLDEVRHLFGLTLPHRVSPLAYLRWTGRGRLQGQGQRRHVLAYDLAQVSISGQVRREDVDGLHGVLEPREQYVAREEGRQRAVQGKTSAFWAGYRVRMSSSSMPRGLGPGGPVGSGAVAPSGSNTT